MVNNDLHCHNFIKYAFSLVRFDYICNPGAVPSINESQIGGYHLVLPILTEQQQIAQFLDQETAKIDNLINESTNVISLLKERRSALISSAVTGKIDVRNFVPSQPTVEATA